MKLGFREVWLYGAEKPAVCREASRLFVWALLGKDGVFKPDQNAIRIESQGVNGAAFSAQSKHGGAVRHERRSQGGGADRPSRCLASVVYSAAGDSGGEVKQRRQRPRALRGPSYDELPRPALVGQGSELAMKSIFCCAFALAAALPFAAIAQTNPRYIRFSPGATKGALYSPDSGPSPVVGILVIHRTSNFMESLACTELSARGYLVLCMNPRSDNNEAAVYWDHLALDVRSGVEFLRKQPGIRKILLWGHSGGGPTTTFYQATAENGVPYCQGTNKLIPCSDELAGLPPADGIILADAHPGNSVNAIRSLNGAVTNDEQIINRNALPKIDRALYPFRTENGYAADGASSFPAEFRKKYFAAQARRMNKLIDLALVKLNRILK
jgi:hypothetical protein